MGKPKARGIVAADRQDMDERQRDDTSVSNTTKRKKLEGSFASDDGPDDGPDEASVQMWVYQFLGNLAAIEKSRKAKMKPTFVVNEKRKSKVKKNLYRLRSPTPYSWDRVSPSSSTHNPADSVNSVHGDEDDAPQTEPKLANNSRTRAPRASDTNSQRVDKQHEKRTVLRNINRYIKAGITAGKRQAKRYVRKALCFALESGYLIPVDRDCKLLRISSTLVNLKSTATSSVDNKKKQHSTLKVRRKQNRVAPKAAPTTMTTRKRGKMVGDGEKKADDTGPVIDLRIEPLLKRRASDEEMRDASESCYSENSNEKPESRSSSSSSRAQARGNPSDSNHQEMIIEDTSTTNQVGSPEEDRKPDSDNECPRASSNCC